MKTEFLEAHKSQVLEIGPECPDLLRHGGGEAGSETGPEADNLVARGCESGCGRCSAWEVAGVPEGARRQVFRFPVFQKADVGNCSGDDRLVPFAAIRH